MSNSQHEREQRKQSLQHAPTIRLFFHFLLTTNYL